MTEQGSLMLVLSMVLALVLAVGVWRNGPDRRRQRLRERFGPEYEVAVEQHGESGAIRVLEARERRVSKLPLRSLSSVERVSFARSWLLVRRDFEDVPHQAVRNAHELVQRTLHARGYPVDDFDQCVAALSVDYGEVVQHYRAAHALDRANHAGQVDSDELRQGLAHYRALFEELLGTPPGNVAPTSQRYEHPALARQPALPH
jgi:hypothetical protein